MFWYFQFEKLWAENLLINHLSKVKGKNVQNSLMFEFALSDETMLRDEIYVYSK